MYHGPSIKDDFLILINRLIESLECGLKNIIIIQSLAGGTGSGVGSYLS